MGCGNPSDSKIQTFFSVERQKINQCVEPTYLILHQNDTEFSNTHRKFLIQKFPDLRILKSKAQLQRYSNELKNNVLAIFCTNIAQLKQYCSLKNIKVFDKIILITTFRLADNNSQRLRQQRRKQLGFRFHKLLEWKDDISLLVKQFEKAASFRNIFFCHRDAGRINRSNLTYNYIMNNQQNFEKQAFFSWLQSQDEAALAQQIDKLAPTEASRYLIQQIFEGNKALNNALEVIKKTLNPAILPHFGWFYKSLYIFIKYNYYQNIKTIYKPNQQFSIWVKALEQQKALFKKSDGQNFIFNGFVIGYLKQSKTIPPGLPIQYMKFDVNIPNMPFKQSQYHKQCRLVDHGFFIHKDKVIFNVMNYFRLGALSNEDRQCDVLYSPIARQHTLRKTQYRYSKDASTANKNMMKLFDVYLLNRKQVNTQRDLFFYLQMYGSYKETCQRLGKSLGSFGGTGSTLPSRASSKYMISQASERERIGEADELLGNFDEAIKRYDEMPDKTRGLVMKQLYFYSQIELKSDEFSVNQRQIQQQFQSNFSIKEPKSFLHFIIKALSAQMKIINKSFSEAQKCICECIIQYQAFYNTIYKIDREKYKDVREDDKIYLDSVRLTFLYDLILEIQHTIATNKDAYDEANLLRIESDQVNDALDGIHIKKILD